MTHEALPWLGFPPTVDLANTVMVTLAGELDLLEDEGQLGAWIAAERGRIVGVEAASGRLPEVRALRETVRELLHARANGEPPPEAARRRVNAICASVPVRAVLTDEGRAVEEPDARDTYALFESTVSRSAVELADRDEDRLSVPRGASRRFARTGPTFDLSTPRAKPIANLTASLAGFGLDPLREFVRSGRRPGPAGRGSAGGLTTGFLATEVIQSLRGGRTSGPRVPRRAVFPPQRRGGRLHAPRGLHDGVILVGRTSAGPPDDEKGPRGQRGVTPPGRCDACW